MNGSSAVSTAKHEFYLGVAECTNILCYHPFFCDLALSVRSIGGEL